MKKVIALFLLIVSVFGIISCGKQEEHHEPEEENYNYISDTKRGTELNDYEYKSESAKKYASVNYEGKLYQVEYIKSRKTYLYNSDCDMYYTKFYDGKSISARINQNTGRMDSLYIYDENYLNSKSSDKELSEEECTNIAKEYLKKFTDDISQYEISSSRFDESSVYNAVYMFEFSRSSDGVKTSDRAAINVTVYGDVYSCSLYSFGEMKDAKLPSDYKEKTDENNIDEKIKSIYSDTNFTYVSHKLKDTVFMKMRDGRYAVDLTYEVEIMPRSGGDIFNDELIQFVVYLD